MDKDKLNGILIYGDHAPLVRALSLEDAGRIYNAIYDFLETGEIKDFPDNPTLSGIWNYIISQAIKAQERYEESKRIGQLGGIIARIKKGNALSNESKQILRELTEEDFIMFSDNGITPQKIQSILDGEYFD